MSVIARAPAAPPAHSPHDPRYFEPRDLEKELRRAFQICHECRMCVGYCGSFPELFARVDRDIDRGLAEGAERLDDADVKAVSDACWQCKLCYVKCPYTPDEGATEQLDFPRLMARERAARAQRDGIPLVDRILGEPQAIGAIGSGAMAPLANLITKSQLLRKVQERLTGVSADFPLPPLAPEPFSRWKARHAVGEAVGESGEVVLFATCHGEFNTPSVARAATLVLEHHGYRVLYPGVDDGAPGVPGGMLTCCGLPNVDGGDVAAATAKIKHNVALLLPHARAGRKILVPGPSCGMMLKREWREYVPTAEVAEVAAATLDLMEFLVVLGKEKKLKREFKRKLGKVAYHAACHLRAQKIGFPGMRVLNVVPETEVQMVEACSAVDGTWGMKAAHYETGRKYAARLTRGIEDAEADFVVTDCSLSSLRIGQENKVSPVHPIEALAWAYGLVSDKEGAS